MIHHLYNQVLGYRKSSGAPPMNNNVWMESYHERSQNDEEVPPNCSLRTPLIHIVWHIGDEMRNGDYLLRSGNRIRVKFGSGTGRFKVDNASIVEMDPDVPYVNRHSRTSKGARAPVELKFAGKSGFSLDAGYKTITSDPLRFELDRSKDYIVIMDVSDGTAPYFAIARTGGDGGYRATNSNSYNVQNADYPLYFNTRAVGVLQVEVYTDDAYNLDIYNATYLNYGDNQGWIKKYYGQKTSLIIPESQYGLELQLINQDAFFGSALKYIEVPATITRLSARSFSNINLEHVHFNGNAPDMTFASDAFDNTHANFHITYNTGATGFTTPTWMGKPCAPIE